MIGRLPLTSAEAKQHAMQESIKRGRKRSITEMDRQMYIKRPRSRMLAEQAGRGLRMVRSMSVHVSASVNTGLNAIRGYKGLGQAGLRRNYAGSYFGSRLKAQV